MKLAKQIILLSAVGLCAIGLSLVLISGIVIGNEVSNSYKTDLRQEKVSYDIQVNNINAKYEGGVTIDVSAAPDIVTTPVSKGLIETEKDKVANKPTTAANTNAVQKLEGYTDVDTGAAVKGDIEKAKDDVKAAQDAVTAAGAGATDADRAAVTAAQEKVSALEAKLAKLKADNATAVEGLEACQKEELAAAKKLYTSKKVDLKTAKKNRIADSFWYVDSSINDRVFTDGSNGDTTAITTYSNERVFTPMGTMMITGIALTLMGAALVVTIVIMNKVGCCQVEEKKATPAKKAA